MRLFRTPRLIAFLLCAGMLVIRGWTRLSRARFWAEDGALFFEQAITRGPAALIKPYAGYYHLIPRLIAFSSTPFPILITPILYMAVCILIMAACFSQLASERSGVLRLPAWLRVGACVALCFVPGMAEVWGNLANVHAVLFFWLALLAMRKEDARLNLFERVAVPLVALTSGEAIVLAPVYAVRAWLGRARSADVFNPVKSRIFNDDLFVVGALGVAALLNATSRSTLPNQEPATFKIRGLLQAYAYGFIEPLTGVHGPEAIWKSSRAGYAALAIALGVVLLAFAILRGKSGRTVWLAILCTMLVPLLTALVRAHAQASLMDGPTDGFSWARYAFQVAPFGFVAWLAALPERRAAQLPALLLIAITCVFGAMKLQLNSLDGPRWRDELHDAQRQPTGPCAAGAGRVLLHIAPDNWAVRLPAAVVCPQPLVTD